MNSIPLHPWTRAAMRKAAVVLTNLSHDKVRELDFDDIQLILETVQTLDQSFAETGVQSPRDWPEDFSHENGNYQNVCGTCDFLFMGHKRRTTCKVCAVPPQEHEPHCNLNFPATMNTEDDHCDCQHDNLRDRIGQALSDALASVIDQLHNADNSSNPEYLAAGAEQPDWCDSRNVDYLADAVIAALDKEPK